MNVNDIVMMRGVRWEAEHRSAGEGEEQYCTIWYQSIYCKVSADGGHGPERTPTDPAEGC